MTDMPSPTVDQFLLSALRLRLARTETYLLVARSDGSPFVEWDFQSLPVTIVTDVPHFLRATHRTLRLDPAAFADVVGYGIAHPATGAVVAVDRYGACRRILSAPDPAVETALQDMMRTAPGLIGTRTRTWTRWWRERRSEIENGRI